MANMTKSSSAQDQLLRKFPDWAWLLLLLALVVPLRGWLMWNTEVLARDGIVYIQYVMELEQHSWQQTLLNNHHHPGYPLSIWAVSVPVRAVLGPADSFTMQLSAQLASNLAAVLLIFPMYFLGKFFFERRVAFWGTLLFQYLPVSGQLLSDGLSEPLFLLLTSLGFLSALWALRRQSAWLFAGSGIFCGLAYLTRPEGALVLATGLLVLAIRPLVPAWKQSWKSAFRCGLAFALAGLAVGSLYFGVTGRFSNKPSAQKMLHVSGGNHGASVNRPKVESEERQPVLFAWIFANYLPKDSELMTKLRRAAAMLGLELMQTFHYAGIPAMFLGMLLRWRGLRKTPEFLLPCLFVPLHLGIVLNLACAEGYLSNRHLMGVAAWGVYFAAAGICDLPGKIWPLWQGWPLSAFFPSRDREGAVSKLSMLLLAGFVVLCLPRTLQKLHGSQAGNHLAGLWLAKHCQRGDKIEDDHRWSSFYAGQRFQPIAIGTGPEQKCYVVITRTRDGKDAREKELRSARAQVVYHYPESQSEEQARIVIYCLPRNFTH